MHRVYCKGVRSLEDKFDKEKADWIEENIATIRFDKIPFEDAAHYNKKNIVIMTIAEYEALVSGKNFAVPHSFVAALKTIATMILDLVESVENTEEDEGNK